MMEQENLMFQIFFLNVLSRMDLSSMDNCCSFVLQVFKDNIYFVCGSTLTFCEFSFCVKIIE